MVTPIMMIMMANEEEDRDDDIDVGDLKEDVD